MGTTILVMRYDSGIVAGADTRTSSSGYVTNRHAAKLTFVLDAEIDDYDSCIERRANVGTWTTVVSPRNHRGILRGRRRRAGGGDDVDLLPPQSSTCVICRSGSAADTQYLSSMVRSELLSRKSLHRVRGTVTHAASLLRNILSDNDDDAGGGGGGGMSASLICAGYDHDIGGGVIYTIGSNGVMFSEDDWAIVGSGSSYLLGYLDSHRERLVDGRRRLMTEEEALSFVHDAIRLARDRDGSSGGYVRMYVIDRHGRRYVSSLSSTNSNRDGGDDDDGTNDDGRVVSSKIALGNFAPAIYPSSVTSIREAHFESAMINAPQDPCEIHFKDRTM